MNTKLFNDRSEFLLWRQDQFPDSRQMGDQVKRIDSTMLTCWPAILVFQWLQKNYSGNGSEFQLIYQWVTLDQFNDSDVYQTVTVTRPGRQPERIVIPPNRKTATEKKQEEKITIIRAITLE
jgi:hypothetical protein